MRQQVGSRLENLGIGFIAALRDNHVGELRCQIHCRVLKFGRLNGSQATSTGGSDNEAARIRIDLKYIARDIGKVIRADDIAERDFIGRNIRAVRVDIGKCAIRRYVDTCTWLGALPSMVAVATAKVEANCVVLAMFSETVLPPGIAMERACGEAAVKLPLAGLKLSV